MPDFWHINHKINNDNTLQNFYFIGITFGIRRMNIKLHTNEIAISQLDI